MQDYVILQYQIRIVGSQNKVRWIANKYENYRDKRFSSQAPHEKNKSILTMFPDDVCSSGGFPKYPQYLQVFSDYKFKSFIWKQGSTLGGSISHEQTLKLRYYELCILSLLCSNGFGGINFVSAWKQLYIDVCLQVQYSSKRPISILFRVKYQTGSVTCSETESGRRKEQTSDAGKQLHGVVGRQLS